MSPYGLYESFQNWVEVSWSRISEHWAKITNKTPHLQTNNPLETALAVRTYFTRPVLTTRASFPSLLEHQILE